MPLDPQQTKVILKTLDDLMAKPENRFQINTFVEAMASGVGGLFVIKLPTRRDRTHSSECRYLGRPMNDEAGETVVGEM